MIMKKSVIITAILFITFLGGVYWMVDRVPSAEAGKNEQMAAIISEAGCLDCHTATPKLPFYASLPLAGDLVKKDAADGYRAFDIEPMYEAVKSGEKVSEVDLAKVEKVVADGTMPPAKYYMVHWSAYINAKEKAIALDWIKECRALSRMQWRLILLRLFLAKCSTTIHVCRLIILFLVHLVTA